MIIKDGKILLGVGGGESWTPTSDQLAAINQAVNGGVPQRSQNLGTIDLHQIDTAEEIKFYHQSSNSQATLARNYPVNGDGGSLLALRGGSWSGSIKTILLFISLNTGKIYTKALVNTTWTPWNHFVYLDEVYQGITSVSDAFNKIPKATETGALQAGSYSFFDTEGRKLDIEVQSTVNGNSIKFSANGKFTSITDNINGQSQNYSVFETSSTLGFKFNDHVDTFGQLKENGRRVFSENNLPSHAQVTGLGDFSTVDEPPNDGRPYVRVNSPSRSPEWVFNATFRLDPATPVENVNLFKASPGGSIDDAKSLRDAYFSSEPSMIEKYDNDPLIIIILEFGDAGSRRQAYQNRLSGNWVLTFDQIQQTIDLSTRRVEELADGQTLINLSQSNRDDLDDIQDGTFRLSPKGVGYDSVVYTSDPIAQVLGETVFISTTSSTGRIQMPVIVEKSDEPISLTQCYEGRCIHVCNISPLRTTTVRSGTPGQPFRIDSSSASYSGVDVLKGTGAKFIAMKDTTATPNILYWRKVHDYPVHDSILGRENVGEMAFQDDVSQGDSSPKARIRGQWIDIPLLERTIVTPLILGDTSLLSLITSQSIGCYYQDNASLATVANGYPFDGAKGSCLVYQSTNSTITQKFIADNGSEYTKTMTDGVLGDWVRELTERDLDDINEKLDNKLNLSEERTTIVDATNNVAFSITAQHMRDNRKFLIIAGNGNVTVRIPPPSESVTTGGCVSIESVTTGTVSVVGQEGSTYNGANIHTYSPSPNGLRIDISKPLVANNYQGVATYGEVRNKSEVNYTGLNITIQRNSQLNIINRLKSLTPQTGSLSPFFDISTDKLKAMPVDKSMFLKIVVRGSFGTAENSGSMMLLMNDINQVVIEHSPAISLERNILVYDVFFSVDKDGTLATAGTSLELSPISTSFTITEIHLICDQCY